MAGPLAGLKVLDFSTLLPGPYATLLLADLGADVLRIVSGSRPDLAALMPPFLPGTKISASAAWLGRNKRSITLNLKDERAIKIVHQLIAEYDILLEQFRPGVMAKLKLGYDDLKKINPNLIYCSLTGYGQNGPMVNRAGHDINYLSRAGLMAHSGHKASGPSLTGMQIADVASGSNNTVVGILAAVIHRTNSQKGQHIDISMTDGVVPFNAMTGTAALVDGQEADREEGMLNGGALYDFYETQDGKYISFGGLEPQFFSAFCNTIDCQDLIKGGPTPQNCQEAKERVRKIMKSKTRDEWTQIFNKTDACFEPVLTLTEALADPLIKEREMVIELPGPDGKKVKQLGCPFKFSETPPQYNHIGEPAGTNTPEVLKSLGYSEKDIKDFGQTGLFD